MCSSDLNTSTRVNNTHNAIADNPKNSICPKGWRLTRSSGTAAHNDFQNLYSYYNAIGKVNGYPLWLVRAGYVDSGSLNISGDRGYCWSSTVNSAYLAYDLGIDSSYFRPSDVSGRYVGFPVRCVAR